MPHELVGGNDSERIQALKERLSGFETEAGRRSGLRYKPRRGDVFITTSPKVGWSRVGGRRRATDSARDALLCQLGEQHSLHCIGACAPRELRTSSAQPAATLCHCHCHSSPPHHPNCRSTHWTTSHPPPHPSYAVRHDLDAADCAPAAHGRLDGLSRGLGGGAVD